MITITYTPEQISQLQQEAQYIGFKVLTSERQSPMLPKARYFSHFDTFDTPEQMQQEMQQETKETGFRGKGTILTYPINTLVKEPNFCPCNRACCRGLHFFKNLLFAKNFIQECRMCYQRNPQFIIVNCFAPKFANVIISRKPFVDPIQPGYVKLRSSHLITLDIVKEP